jgi:septum formation inhibitor-activating ATPase MinD
MDLVEVEKIIELPVVARVKDHKKILEASHFKVPITVYDSLNEVSREVKRLAASLVGEKEKMSFISRIFGKHFSKEKENRESLRYRLYESPLPIN